MSSLTNTFFWGDGSTTSDPHTFSPGSTLCPISQSHTYTSAGTYEAKQWLDNNANGIQDKGDQQDPIHFVRKKADTVKVTSIVLFPTLVTNFDAAKYKLEGTFLLSGVSTGIVLLSPTTGVKDPITGTWTFTNLVLSTPTTFNNVASFLPMTIEWKLLRQADQPLNKMNASTTLNPVYITYDHVAAAIPASFPLLRTFVHLGSADVPAGVDLDTRAKMIDHIWTKFSDAKIKTWDSRELVYYKDWIYRELDEPDYVTSYGLVKGGAGECTSFARLFIDALRAQGIENTDELVSVKPNLVPGQYPVMFVGSWTKVGDGKAALAAFPDYKWTNGSNEFVESKRHGWKADGGYVWTEAHRQVTKGDDDPLKGQNNSKPLGIFALHRLVKIGETYYDPSYGTTAASLKAWENSAVKFYGLMAKMPGGDFGTTNVVYLLKENPGADKPIDVIQALVDY